MPERRNNASSILKIQNYWRYGARHGNMATAIRVPMLHKRQYGNRYSCPHASQTAIWQPRFVSPCFTNGNMATAIRVPMLHKRIIFPPKLLYLPTLVMTSARSSVASTHLSQVHGVTNSRNNPHVNFKFQTFFLKIQM